MFSQSIVSLSLWATLAAAHFGIDYPEWRGDSFADGASQYIYPCANITTDSSTPRTEWPLTGGSLSLHLSHPGSYIFINLGIGTESLAFNISLTNPFLNETGNGTLCFPTLALPAGLPISEGTNASIQVVTTGEGGNALYNCADITFSSAAQILGNDTCANSSNVAAAAIKAAAGSGASVSLSGSVLTVSVVFGLGALTMSWLL